MFEVGPAPSRTRAAMASSSSSSTAPPSASAPSAPADHLAHGIRALALKRWADACDHLALAVEHSTNTHGDLAPENVDALVLYGKALLGSAIAQSAVLGGAAPQDNPSDAPSTAAAAGPSASGSSSSNTAAGPSNPKFHFGGDGEDDGEGEAEAEGGEGDGEGEDEGEDGAPGADREDDLESAFQVLDMARAILKKEVDQVESELERAVKDEAKDKKDELDVSRRTKKEQLADVHRLLGDVATESEQFEPAVTEYSAALSSLSTVVAPHDRALSELHMLIALALDFVPNGTERAVEHAEQAKGVLVLKLAELEQAPEADRDDKVKREIDDIKGLLGDVDMKIEDLRTVPTAPAPTAADSALEALLRQSQGVVAQQQQSGSVNDLSALVKRKKKAPDAAAAPAPAGVVVQEEVKVEGDEAKGGNEENVVRVVEGGVKKEDEQAGEVDAAALAPKRKAEDREGEGEAKKAKVEQ